MLLNVRLGEEEERIVRGLRRRKVNVSALVRRELVAAGTALLQGNKKATSRAAIEEILRKLPVSAADRPSPRPRLDDRAALRRHLRKKLARR